MSKFGKNGFAVWMFGKLMGFASALQGIPNKVTPPPFRLMQISTGFWQSRVLYVAARMNIASELGDDRLSAEELATRLGANPDSLFRLMRTLCSMGIFREVAPRCYANNKLSEPLRDDSGQCIRPMVLMHNAPEMSRPWFEQLEEGIRRGEPPFLLTHGAELFDYMDAHAEFDELFSRAMDSVDALVGESFATDFDWGRFGRLIDVGGSQGAKTISILRHHSSLQALVYDRPQVVEAAAGHLAGRVEPDILRRMSFEGGDMFERMPPAQDAHDVYLLSAVFHGIDDEAALRALQRLSEAIGNTGARAVLMELVMAERHPEFAETSFDMQMLMGTRGRERTESEWRALFAKGGFDLIEVAGLRSFGKLLVIRPRQSSPRGLGAPRAEGRN